jgi:prolipoprotein diacylglyceryltransferase
MSPILLRLGSLSIYAYGFFLALGVEMVRGDPRGSLFYGLLSTSQGIGIFLGILSLFMLFYLRIKPRR